MKTPRLRFSLRTLLLLPVLVAAFYGGWITHEHQLRRDHRRQEAAALQLRTSVHAEIQPLHDELDRLDRERAIDAARLLKTMDQLEHQQRIDVFRSRLLTPSDSRMPPEVRFQ